MPVNPTDQQEFSDADFRIVDNGDQSKKLAFQVSGIATATTRTWTVPDSDVTVTSFIAGLLNDTTAAEARTTLFGVSTTTDNAVARYDGTTGALQNSGVIIDDSNNVSGVGTLASGAITASGTVTGAGVTLSGTNQLSLGAGGQIAFPATRNASAGANVLDEYEEATLTATMAFGGSSSGVTYSAQTTYSTAIGRQITMNGHVTLTNNGSGTGTAAIGGLSVSPLVGTPGCGFLAAGGSAATGIFPFADGSGNLVLYIPGAVGGALATDTNCTNTFDFYFSITYMV